MTVVVTKCPKCGGQIKLKEQWKEGFCLYCGTKVINNITAIRYDEDCCDTEDETVDNLFEKLCEKLSTENIREYIDIQKVKISVQSHMTDYGNKIRTSKNRYAKKMNAYCHHVSTISFETTKKNWDELKNAVSGLNKGCALCIAYEDFSEAFLKSVDKLSSVLSLRWESSRFKKRNTIDIDKSELSDMRKRTEAVRVWLNRRQEETQNTLSTVTPKSRRN